MTSGYDARVRRRVLVVEDDPKIRSTIELYLQREGFDVVGVERGDQAVAAAHDAHLVILDIMLPGGDGIEICRAIRAVSPTPIIFLTARSTEEDKLRGLDVGADDYVTKPFSPRELMARVRAVFRRAPAATDTLTVGRITIDGGRRAVSVDGKEIALTPTEYRLLDALARAAGRTVTREQLIRNALGEDYEGLDRTVDVHIKNLRRKLGDAGESVVTVFGAGYRVERA
jgi:two-component system alkaline phosphatase synthesis response regulator PhoP